MSLRNLKRAQMTTREPSLVGPPDVSGPSFAGAAVQVFDSLPRRTTKLRILGMLCPVLVCALLPCGVVTTTLAVGQNEGLANERPCALHTGCLTYAKTMQNWRHRARYFLENCCRSRVRLTRHTGKGQGTYRRGHTLLLLPGCEETLTSYNIVIPSRP